MIKAYERKQTQPFLDVHRVVSTHSEALHNRQVALGLYVVVVTIVCKSQSCKPFQDSLKSDESVKVPSHWLIMRTARP